MAQIIQFPSKENWAYTNMVELFGACCSLDICNVYLDVIENLYDEGHITEKEMYTLRRIGRTKRLELAKAETIPATEVEEPGAYCYTPEMGQEKPECQMEATRGYDGKHVYIYTPLEPKGRGIRFIKKCSATDFVKGAADHRCGWNEYCVTNRAFEKLKEQYTISMEALLD